MRYVLLTVALLLLSPHRAAADHISVYSDATGSSCYLGPPAFSTTATVIHKFTVGATGSRFKVTLPPGSSYFGFNTPYVPIGVLTSDLSLGYGLCLDGTIPLGTITAILAPGEVLVGPAVGFSNVIVADCSFVEHVATCGGGYVGTNFPYCPFCQTVVTDQKTWGAVKSLYRE